MNAQVGNFEIPLTGRELLTALRDGKPVQIGRAFLGKALLLIEQCAEACVDVKTEGDKALLTPKRFRLTETGERAIANPGHHDGAAPAPSVDGVVLPPNSDNQSERKWR